MEEDCIALMNTHLTWARLFNKNISIDHDFISLFIVVDDDDNI